MPMKGDIFYKIEVEILVTARQRELTESIKEEISVLCSKLERLGGQTNHIYLHNLNVVEERD